jgi:ribose transport system permease protein
MSANRPSQRRSLGGTWFGASERHALILLVISVLLILGSRFINPALGSWNQAVAILVVSTFVMIAAFGQQTVILTGGLDLSIPSNMALGAILMFSMVGAGGSLFWGIPMVLAVTGAIGALNGMGVALMRMPPLIMTLGMDFILKSALLGATGGAPQGTAPTALTSLFASGWLGMPPVVYLMAAFIVLATVLQRRTAFGRMVYAIGTNPDAARIAGLPVRRVVISCYVLSGAAAGFAGILMVGFSHGATLNSGDNILIPSIAAVVLGGTSILGGRGIYPGAVAGALLLATFSTIILTLGIHEGWRILIYGAVILWALLTLEGNAAERLGRLRRTLLPARDRSPHSPEPA